MAYMRRVPQETSLHKVVSQYFDPFVKELEATGKFAGGIAFNALSQSSFEKAS